MAIGMFGAIMFVPLYMQGVVGISASESGTVMTSMMLSMISASIIGGRVVRYVGVRNQILLGMAIMATGFWLLSTMDLTTSKWTAISHMIILGLGLGLVMPTITLALQESFPKAELGVVTASSQFFRQIGGTFGMTILGVVMNYESTRFLTEKLVPFLEQLPKGASQLVTKTEYMIVHDPQRLYSFLLSPEAIQKIPVSVQQSMIPILKTTFVESLHYVFLTGLLIVMVGFFLAGFLGKIALTKKEKELLKST
jgi:MFS family permease